MHPPLDRPHPGCEATIQALRECHATAGWRQYLIGACNDTKFALDRCFRDEKKRLLTEMNRELPERQVRQDEIVKHAFGQEMTFSEYLQRDAAYLAEVAKKQQQPGE
jgi:COX assembly protein 2